MKASPDAQRLETPRTSTVASSFIFGGIRDSSLARLREGKPGWAFVVFVVAVCVAYSPGVLSVFSILADFDALALKREHYFFHNEAVHLLSIARPVAALLSNLPVPFVSSPEDFRWFHLFALLTVCFLGWQTIRICMVRLYTSAWEAVAIALATFLGLIFIFAVLESTAWAPHLFTTLLALWAYWVLAASNARLLSFPDYVARGDYRLFFSQLLAYCALRPVWVSVLIYQCAFYSYPPFALLVVIFPVVTILFSRAPAAYRHLLAVRDVGFVGANVVLFFLSTALVYLPIVRLFTEKGSGHSDAYESDYVANLYAAQQFAYNTDVMEIVQRIGHLLKVSGDLWFLPQTRMHVLTAMVFLLAVLATSSRAAVLRPGSQPRMADHRRGGIVEALVLLVCFLLAASPVLASAGGFVAYRTAVATTAMAAIIFVFAIRTIADSACRLAGLSSLQAERAGGVAMALAVGAAFAANAYANYAVMKLGQNEYAYFTQIVRKAIDDKSKTIVIIDPRPWAGPQAYRPWPVYDQRGRAVPPFELGCFASFCMQNGSIVRVIAAELGLSPLNLVVTRGDDPVPGMTCDMLEGPAATYPPNASTRSRELVDRYRAMAPLTCVMAHQAWHDLGVDLGH